MQRFDALRQIWSETLREFGESPSWTAGRTVERHDYVIHRINQLPEPAISARDRQSTTWTRLPMDPQHLRQPTPLLVELRLAARRRRSHRTPNCLNAFQVSIKIRSV